MKIGILTQPLLFNYGGILQNYALQRVLSQMGHDVFTIDQQPVYDYALSVRHIIGYFKRLFDYIVLNKKITKDWNPNNLENLYKAISVNTREFVKKNIVCTYPTTKLQLNKIDDEYRFDAYVVGSDQVWIPSYVPESFLNFVNRDNVAKVFYAASCGDTSWMDLGNKARNYCVYLTKSFSGISVREDYLVKKTESLLRTKVEHVLDPTMLLSQNDYLSKVERCTDNSPIIFTYILDQTELKKDISKFVSEYFKLPIVNCYAKQSYENITTECLDDCVFPPVDDWINGINRASFIVTDSFHGTVFAILFNKPFVAIGNERRGLLRFQSLLKMFDLENRLVQNEEELSNIVDKDIDYSRVNKLIEVNRNNSIDFLRETLSPSFFKTI